MTIKERRDAIRAKIHVSVQEFAFLLDMHPGSIYHMIASSRLAGVSYVGRSIRIDWRVALADRRAHDPDYQIPFNTTRAH